MTESLEVELNFYQKIKDDLVSKTEGKFALIHGQDLIGVYDSQEAAYSEGLKRFGNVPMLITRIQREEPTVWIPALQLGLIRADLHK